MAARSENEGTSDGETYIEKYTRGVLQVENILSLERLRQARKRHFLQSLHWVMRIPEEIMRIQEEMTDLLKILCGFFCFSWVFFRDHWTDRCKMKFCEIQVSRGGNESWQ